MNNQIVNENIQLNKKSASPSFSKFEQNMPNIHIF